MTTQAVVGWRDVKAELARHDVTLAQVAVRLGYRYARLSTIIASEDETMPRPEFVERLIGAIESIASERKQQ